MWRVFSKAFRFRKKKALNCCCHQHELLPALCSTRRTCSAEKFFLFGTEKHTPLQQWKNCAAHRAPHIDLHRLPAPLQFCRRAFVQRMVVLDMLVASLHRATLLSSRTITTHQTCLKKKTPKKSVQEHTNSQKNSHHHHHHHRQHHHLHQHSQTTTSAAHHSEERQQRWEPLPVSNMFCRGGGNLHLISSRGKHRKPVVLLTKLACLRGLPCRVAMYHRLPSIR